jgi:PPOX class probable F420-dependent enzyme
MADLTQAQIDFLHSQRVAHLATVDEAGMPHVVPICFACVDGAVYTAIDDKPKRVDPRGLRRLRNIQTNGNVCILVDHFDEDWTRLAWLQVRGVAMVVDDLAERSHALAALRDRYPQYRRMALETLPLLRVTPLRIVDWQARDDSSTSSPAASRGAGQRAPSTVPSTEFTESM